MHLRIVEREEKIEKEKERKRREGKKREKEDEKEKKTYECSILLDIAIKDKFYLSK
jgi:hypothetical protein